MSDMNEYARIKEIGKVITGKTPSTENEENFDGEFPFITPSDISTFDEKYIVETERTISSKGYKKMKNNLLPINTICFVCIGSTIGKMCLTKKPSFTNQQINALIVNENYDAQYVFYLLRYVKGYFQQIGAGTGSGKGIVNKSTFEKSRICVEKKLLTQKEISSILSAYDDLIENNNKRIKILEQMAENLYKEWFVRFRFPGYETAEFENGIPKEWNRDKIHTYYNTCSGGTPNRGNEEYFENGVYPWVKTSEIKDCVIIDTEEYITQEAVKKSSAKILPSKSLAMAMYGVNIGLLAYLDAGFTCNQACCVFVDKRNFSSINYLYQYLKSIREYLLSVSFGAAQQNISQEIIRKIKIIMPSNEIITAFEKQIDNIYGEIRILLVKNKNLTVQRDSLLPRLMSGKLEV